MSERARQIAEQYLKAYPVSSIYDVERIESLETFLKTLPEFKTEYACEPIANVVWTQAATLGRNDWNPNMVLTPEMKLLEYSILSTGWIQPILANKNRLIIDGFHRWILANESKALQAKYHGFVPVVTLDISDAEAMLLTVRINRAKGVHAAYRMAELVKKLIDVHGYTKEQIGRGIGANKDEVDLLYQDGVFSQKKTKDYKYSEAWAPGENAPKK